jgi:hypothetical protein
MVGDPGGPPLMTRHQLGISFPRLGVLAAGLEGLDGRCGRGIRLAAGQTWRFRPCHQYALSSQSFTVPHCRTSEGLRLIPARANR